MQQEELVRLFSHSLNFANVPLPPTGEDGATQPAPNASRPQPITYITQHYHHSAHIRAEDDPNSLSDAEVKDLLRRSHVDPDCLFPTQLELFRNAAADQRLRLIELWCISPPSYGGHALAHELGSWPVTSLEQEEAMAKLRHDRKNRAMAEEPTVTTAQDTDVVSAATCSLAPEPYMLSGYESLAQRDYEEQVKNARQPEFARSTYRPAIDPVYADAATWPNVEQSAAQLRSRNGDLQVMEDQYGFYQHVREYGASQRPVCGFVGYDTDMVM